MASSWQNSSLSGGGFRKTCANHVETSSHKLFAPSCVEEKGGSNKFLSEEQDIIIGGRVHKKVQERLDN